MSKKEDQLLADALTRFDKSISAEHEDRLLMEEDLAFAGGEQWPDSVKRARESRDEPCLTFNRLPAFIAQVVGDARRNKPAVKVHPIDDGADKDVAEIYEGLIRNIELQSQAPTAYLTAFEHAVTGGAGAWRIYTEYTHDDGFEQDIKIGRITDPFSVVWDHNAKNYDKSDAKYCFVSEWVTKEFFESKYPKQNPNSWETVYTGGGTRHWSNGDRVRLAEYWVKEPVQKEIGMLPDGQVIDVTDVVEQAVEMGQIEIVKRRKVNTHKIVRYLLSGHAILEGPQEFPSRYIPIIPCFGPEEFIEGRMRHRSLIRYAKDPQRMYNYWQTVLAEKIALAPKSPWLVTQQQIAGYEKFWNKANKESRAYLPYNHQEGAPMPQRQEPAYVNAAEIQQSAQAIDDLKATMGIFDASMGAQGNETSGRAILARQREGDTATYAWIDNLARSIERTGKILIDMIPRIYDTARVIRVLGEDEADEMVQINTVVNGELVNDMTTGKYDVAISVGPSYQTRRLEAADSMMQFFHAFPPAGELAGDLVAQNMDWPGAEAIAERLKKALPPQFQDSEDMEPEEREALKAQQDQQKERESVLFELDVKERIAERNAKEAKAARDNAEAESKAIENFATRSELGF